MNKHGFTMIEILVVVLIIVLLSFVSIPLFTSMFQSKGVREGASLVTNVISNVRELAARSQDIYFIELTNTEKCGQMKIYKDKKDANGVQDKKLVTNFDILLDQIDIKNPIFLPDNIVFHTTKTNMKKFPNWIMFTPTGYCMFSSSMDSDVPPQGVNSETMELNFAETNPNPLVKGDIVLSSKEQPEKMCIDINNIIGEVSEMYFLSKDE